jgi:hypothetical protein
MERHEAEEYTRTEGKDHEGDGKRILRSVQELSGPCDKKITYHINNTLFAEVQTTDRRQTHN